MKNNLFLIFCGIALAFPASALETLCLDSCRTLALRNNKQMTIAKLKEGTAHDIRKAAQTKYYPHIDAYGTYMRTNKEISLLNDRQKNALSNMGTTTADALGGQMAGTITDLAQKGVITPEQAAFFGNILSESGNALGQALNEVGKQIKDDFRSDTRNFYAASVMLTQPLYMGGAIIAANKMARLNEELSESQAESQMQNTLYETDKTYWLVVSLRQKQKLAANYLNLIKKLDGDVQKMIETGVATYADGLKVSVRLNEAEMTLTQVENGLSLAKMCLCQLCGLPISDQITLEDEEKADLISLGDTENMDNGNAKNFDNRPELKMLEKSVEMSKQVAVITRAPFLPSLALTGGYTATNPNLYNGFQNKFGGVWNVGVVLRVPLWNWLEGVYTVRAAKSASAIAAMQLTEAREKIELQVTQNSYKMSEANKRLAISRKNTERAEENLRCANAGFEEGVMQATEVMEAQTAWLQAHSQEIDAKINIKVTQVELQKSLGNLK